MALRLDIHLEGQAGPVGRLTRAEDGTLGFAYLRNDLPYPVSLSLPLQEAPFGDAATRAFFANLLFENAQRYQVMERHRLDFNDIAGLLHHLGRDCPGAISCVPEGAGPAKQPGELAQDYDPLDAEALAEIMRALRDHRRVPEATRDPSPLAGVQGKVALAQLPDGRFALPRPDRNVPTTHVLKVPRLPDMRTVEHEHLAMRLMERLQGHPVAETAILGEGELRGLLVTRFDRRLAAGAVHRLHQEDFAQALGLAPGLKYQRNGTPAHGFDAAAVGRVLARTENPGRARQAFLEVTLANLLLGNTDNHAKNHALLHEGPRPRLAPVYDVVPVITDPQVLHQLSFDIGAARMTDEITLPDLAQLTAALGFPRMTPALRRRIEAMVRAAASHIPEMRGPARKPLGDAIAEQAGALAAALEMPLELPERDGLVLNRPD